MSQIESWTEKLLFIVAFVCASGASWFLLLPLHRWVSVAYPVLDNPVIGILMGFVLMAPVYPSEIRFLRRFTDREYLAQFPSPNKLFRDIQPVSYGILIGASLAFSLAGV